MLYEKLQQGIFITLVAQCFVMEGYITSNTNTVLSSNRIQAISNMLEMISDQADAD
jgi:hypothetical protein